MAFNVKWQMVALFALVVSLNVNRVTSSKDILKSMTVGFAKALEQCKVDLQLGDHIMADFYNYWREDYELVNQEFGCAIMCLAHKFNMITDENKLHHENAQEFAKSHGADAEMAKQIVDMIHECENKFEAIKDECNKVLELAKCFRTKIHGLKWAPDMETVMREVMTEV